MSQIVASHAFAHWACQLEVTDTAGAEQFTALNEFYIKAAHGFILVFRYVVEHGLLR